MKLNFTKVELILISLVALLFVFAAFLGFSKAQESVKNERVLKDIGAIYRALEIFHDENGFYPTGNGTPDGIDNYLDNWPKPSVKCGGISIYSYTQKQDGDEFDLKFCLSRDTKEYIAGIHTLNSRGIN